MKRKKTPVPEKGPARRPKPEKETDPTASKQGFFEDVFDIVRQIPTGRVTSYGSIAQYLGTRMSARMVGWAMNASHVADPPVPAQRVVNRLGMLSGKHHFPTPTRMEELLKKDGVDVKDNQVLRFKEIFWNPNEEINLES
jgi:methylated-DNA-protein-cysteine methyltransferase related protein